MNLVILIAKVMVLLAAIFVALQYKKPSKKWAKMRACCVILFALLAQITSMFWPSATDTITIQALGEKNELSQSDEVWLSGIVVDGETVQIPMPEQGKWFWIGENYAWRNENDNRQPQGTTREISLYIPVGVERLLQFTTSPWGGMCKIRSEDFEITVDTYSETNSSIEVQMKRSSVGLIVRQVLQEIAVFAIVMIVLGGLFCKIENSFRKLELKQKKKYKESVCKQIGPAIVAAIAFVWMIWYAGISSFWSDELHQIGVINRGIGDGLSAILNMREATPPLFSICLYIWYRIAPYGEQWLLLISIIPTVLSIYLIGLICTKLTDNMHTGILGSILAATSSTLWIMQAFELRAYAFTLFFATTTLYLHIRRSESIKFEICYSVSVLCLAMSHYFAMIVCGIFFIADFLQMLNKRLSFKKIVALYSMPAIGSIFWLICVYFVALKNNTTASIASWYVVPNLKNIYEVLLLLTGNKGWMVVLLVIVISSVLVKSCMKVDDNERYISGYYLRFSIAMVVSMIMMIFLYGNLINQESTMWEPRYFMVLTPFIMVIISIGLGNILKKIDQLLGNKQAIVQSVCCITFAAVLSFVLNNVVSVPNWPVEPYRESADWLYEQANDIYSDKTAVIITTTDLVKYGWTDYYLTQQGRRDPINCYNIQQFLDPKKDLLNFDKIYLQYSLVGIPQDVQEVLNQYFTLESDYQNLSICVYNKNYHS